MKEFTKEEKVTFIKDCYRIFGIHLDDWSMTDERVDKIWAIFTKYLTK